VVECSPATRAARVRFPASAIFFSHEFLVLVKYMIGLITNMVSLNLICIYFKIKFL
jgi:hypothetical protein